MDTRLRARIGGLARSAQYDGLEVTAKARATFRASFEDQVDPDRKLPEAERSRRAEAARRLFYARMAFRSSQVRARNKTAAATTPAAISPAVREVHGSDATPAS